jgi:hypothetical protein
VGDAHREGELQQSDAQPEGRRRTGHAGGCPPRSGSAECGVGGDLDGIPRRLDRAWPAGRGVDQHPWEPSRTVPARSQAHRKARVKALGNAVVPAVAAIVGERLAHHLNKNV